LRILALDTALSACAAGVVDVPDGVRAQESLPVAFGHAEALMPLIARVMDAAGLVFSGLDRIAVTIGPGSFTGLRVGIAAARGIALAIGKPAMGISTLAAFAAPHLRAEAARSVVSSIDARHGHVYLQVFGPGAGVLTPPRLASVEEAAGYVTEAAVLVGSGAPVLAAAHSRGVKPALVDAREFPEIAWIARLAAAAEPALCGAKPLYLRPPDARPQHAARLPRR
jgi:tRNA threonylcarbamoyladenosine biosynthesis protein TsaB